MMALLSPCAVDRINNHLCIFTLSKFSTSKLEKWRFVKQSLLLCIKLNYFQNAQKGEYFLNNFEALVREIDVRG
jgi:hypothetical protein